MSFNPEELTSKMQSVCGNNLKSVVLYGSAAAGDQAGKRSDYNILVVLNRLGMEDLTAISDISEKWTRAGNPAPLLFTWDRLQQSGDVFPIELSDIKENHKILFGDDPLGNIPINSANMRIELEHELKGKLIQLREKFLLTRGKSGKVRELLISSLSTFLVLFRATLRLHGETPPAKKLQALEVLRKHIEFDEEVFKLVADMKAGIKHPELDPLELFERYLKTIEMVADAVDVWMHK